MHFHAAVCGQPPVEEAADGIDHDAAFGAVLRFVDRHDDDWRIAAVVHRIVHGGTHFTAPVIVTEEVVEALKELVPLAPLHQPHNLAGIAASRRLAPDACDIACFDTAFHASLPAIASTYALPACLRDAGVRKFGFHGLSYEWIAHVLAGQYPALAGGRIVAAHLGNGASLCALHEGRSVETTMGLTALDGVPMGTRSGALDPGAVLYLLQGLGMAADDVAHLLYEQSGLKGLSGISNDVEVLLASPDPQARFALDHFAYHVAQHAAVMATAMGGIDALVFTGGIGEHATLLRDTIVQRLGFIGRFEVKVIAANEERMMAMHARTLLAERGA
jgi:acetate kinase